MHRTIQRSPSAFKSCFSVMPGPLGWAVVETATGRIVGPGYRPTLDEARDELAECKHLEIRSHFGTWGPRRPWQLLACEIPAERSDRIDVPGSDYDWWGCQPADPWWLDLLDDDGDGSGMDDREEEEVEIYFRSRRHDRPNDYDQPHYARLGIGTPGFIDRP